MSLHGMGEVRHKAVKRQVKLEPYVKVSVPLRAQLVVYIRSHGQIGAWVNQGLVVAMHPQSGGTSRTWPLS
jgi:hypothetical protein